MYLPDVCLLPYSGLFGPLCTLLFPLASFILLCPAQECGACALFSHGAIECYGSSEMKTTWLLGKASLDGVLRESCFLLLCE